MRSRKVHAIARRVRCVCVCMYTHARVHVPRLIRSSLSAAANTRVGQRTSARTTTTTRTMAQPHDEVLAAQEAHLNGLADSEERTIFDKIVSKDIPATIIYEDSLALAFRDINPQAKTHFLVIPKIRAGLTRLSKATEEHKMLLGHLMYTAQLVAKQEKLDAGFRVVVNDGVEGCQSVYHLHLHVLGGEQLTWPPGCPPQ
jgi:diadenosine tetraphosphate (Ap4A) HIT family hydrolase